MIDTVKIYCEIDKITHDVIKSKSIVKSAHDNNTGEILYEITNDHLEGSYSSNLSVRASCGSKYHFCKLGYCLEIEGSYHKIIKGYNSHNGYYDLQFIVENLILMVETDYNIKLPNIENWYLQRCDIAIVYDLKNQDNVKRYINSLKHCNYPRRKTKFYLDSSLYLPGSITTLKIYNKLLEFREHDRKKFKGTDFNVLDYEKTIEGFIRFECEIKKRKLEELYHCKYINVLKVKYEDLKFVWSDEFMKLLKFIKNDLEIVRGREKVLQRLKELYKTSKANRLYNFYCSIQLNGIDYLKENMCSSTYYDNLKELEESRVDISQCYNFSETIIDFNPFEFEEVA